MHSEKSKADTQVKKFSEILKGLSGNKQERRIAIQDLNIWLLRPKIILGLLVVALISWPFVDPLFGKYEFRVTIHVPDGPYADAPFVLSLTKTRGCNWNRFCITYNESLVAYPGKSVSFPPVSFPRDKLPLNVLSPFYEVPEVRNESFWPEDKQPKSNGFWDLVIAEIRTSNVVDVHLYGVPRKDLLEEKIVLNRWRETSDGKTIIRRNIASITKTARRYHSRLRHLDSARSIQPTREFIVDLTGSFEGIEFRSERLTNFDNYFEWYIKEGAR